ncbi:MAG: stage II sporulation protein M [archaeon]
MIESLVKPQVAIKEPWHCLLLGVLFCFIAIILTLQLGLANAPGAGFLTISFISIASAPLFVELYKLEIPKGRSLFKKYEHLIKIYAFFFGGIVLASSFFYVLAPNVAKSVLNDQIKELCVKQVISNEGCESFEITGYAVKKIGFLTILLNNLKVLWMCFLLSFVLGAGAVFLVSWNATILGTLIGKASEVPSSIGATGFSQIPLINYLIIFPMVVLSILPHGFFEFLGYFTGAIAGGVLSVGLLKEKILSKEFIEIVKDSFIFLTLSSGLILIGAIIESVL